MQVQDEAAAALPAAARHHVPPAASSGLVALPTPPPHSASGRGDMLVSGVKGSLDTHPPSVRVARYHIQSAIYIHMYTFCTFVKKIIALFDKSKVTKSRYISQGNNAIL